MPELVHVGRMMSPAARAGEPVVVPAWVLTGASLDIDFANNRAWYAAAGETTPGAILTCSRNVAAMARSSAGAWSSFAINTLRRTNLGVLIENTRTNTCLQATDLTNAAWVTTGAAMGGGQTAPDATTNAATLTDSAGSSQHRILNSSVAFSNGQSYILIVRAKAGTGSFIQLTFNTTQFSGAGYANFDLSNGTRSATGGTLVASGIIDEGNGWYACYIVATATGTGSNGLIIARVSTGTAARAEIYSGTDTTVLLWCPGVYGANVYPASPVYTVGSTVQRLADNITPNAATQALMDAAKSAYAETREMLGGSTPRILDFAGVASLQAAAGQTGTTVSTVGGSTATATIGSAGTTFGLVKSAFSFDGTTNKAVANGGTLASTAGTWGVVSETPTIGNLAALTNGLNGYLGRIAFSSSADNFNTLTV